MVFVWNLLVRPLGGVWDIYELLPAFLVSCLCIVVASLLTAPPSPGDPAGIRGRPRGAIAFPAPPQQPSTCVRRPGLPQGESRPSHKAPRGKRPRPSGEPICRRGPFSFRLRKKQGKGIDIVSAPRCMLKKTVRAAMRVRHSAKEEEIYMAMEKPVPGKGGEKYIPYADRTGAESAGSTSRATCPQRDCAASLRACARPSDGQGGRQAPHGRAARPQHHPPALGAGPDGKGPARRDHRGDQHLLRRRPLHHRDSTAKTLEGQRLDLLPGGHPGRGGHRHAARYRAASGLPRCPWASTCTNYDSLLVL